MRKQLRTAALPDPVVVGKVGSTYGIHGWLKVFSSTEEAKSIFNYEPWFIKKPNEWRPIRLESWKRHNQALLIKVKDIDDREAATLLTNCEIVIDASQLPDLDNGEYYWKDLIGCQVVTVGGYQLGEVIDLIETGSNDVLVVKANPKDAFGIQERLIPFLDRQVIMSVDLTLYVIKVDWDPGF
ncbi:MAG: ribosome maturation factor RimM [Sodalis sp. (in: enterobacteria)]